MTSRSAPARDFGAPSDGRRDGCCFSPPPAPASCRRRNHNNGHRGQLISPDNEARIAIDDEISRLCAHARRRRGAISSSKITVTPRAWAPVPISDPDLTPSARRRHNVKRPAPALRVIQLRRMYAARSNIAEIAAACVALLTRTPMEMAERRRAPVGVLPGAAALPYDDENKPTINIRGSPDA